MKNAVYKQLFMFLCAAAGFTLQSASQKINASLQELKKVAAEALLENYKEHYIVPAHRLPKEFVVSDAQQGKVVVSSRDAFVKKYGDKYTAMQSVIQEITSEKLCDGIQESISHLDPRDFKEILLMTAVAAKHEANTEWENVKNIPCEDLEKAAWSIKAYENLAAYLSDIQKQQIVLEQIGKPVVVEIGYTKRIIVAAAAVAFFVGSRLPKLVYAITKG